MPELHPTALYYTNVQGHTNHFGFYDVMDGEQIVGYIPYNGPGNFREMLQHFSNKGYATPVQMGVYQTRWSWCHCLEFQTCIDFNQAIILPKFEGDALRYFVIQHPPQTLDEASRLIIRVIDGKQGPLVVDNEFVYDIDS